MTISLPDVNVWIALTAEAHPQHAPAREWFATQSAASIAFCRITHMGLLRLLTNPKVMGGAPRTVAQAWAVATELRRDRRVLFAVEPEGVELFWQRLMTQSGAGPQFWTDAYLAAFAFASSYRFITFDTDRYEIVGIAPAMAVTSMKERPYAMWVPLRPDTVEAVAVVRTSQPPEAVLPAIRRTVSDIDRKLPMVDVVTMEEQIAKWLQRERMFATLCGGFGILAVALAVVGLYGVMAYSTSRRRAEIGVRLALDAQPRNVLAMVLREGLALAGILLGLPVVWLGAKFAEKELFQMKVFEPASLTAALGILLLAALIAGGAPAARASALHPSETLRQD